MHQKRRKKKNPYLWNCVNLKSTKIMDNLAKKKLPKLALIARENTQELWERN
jgi:hypothetical protein